MNPEKGLSSADEEQVRTAMSDLATRGCFTNPATPTAESKLLDEVREDLPGFAHASELIVPILLDSGWDEHEVGLLASGVDMALMLVHEVLVKGQTTRPDAKTPER